MRPSWKAPALVATLPFLLGCEGSPTSADVLPPRPADSAAVTATDTMLRLSGETVERIDLEIVTAERHALPTEVVVSGQIVPNADRTVRVASYIAGIVTDCCKSIGDTVTEGETLTVLHTHQTHDLLAEYRQAVAEFRATQSELELARETYRRESRLLELKVGSVVRVQTAEAALTRAESAVEAADASIEAAIAHIEYLVNEVPAAMRNRETGPVPDFDVEVKAPIAGTIISRAITQGDVVAPTDELYRVSDLSRVWVLAQVPEERLSAVAIGMDAAIRVRAYPDRVFEGAVTRIAPELDAETRTVQVRCEVDNLAGALKTGMYATIGLRATEPRTALVVPESAIQQVESDAFVFTPVGDGQFWLRPVTLGQAVDSSVEVVTGLAEGDRVVARGSFLLKAELMKSRMAVD